MNILTYLRAKYGSEEGATATEYVFLLVFIALAIIAGATLLGDAINVGFGNAASEVGESTASG